MKPWIHIRFMLENLLAQPVELLVRPVASPIPNARVWLLMDQLQTILILAFWTTDQQIGKYQFHLDLALLQPLNTAEVIIGYQLFWSEFQLEFLRSSDVSYHLIDFNIINHDLWINLFSFTVHNETKLKHFYKKSDWKLSCVKKSSFWVVQIIILWKLLFLSKCPQHRCDYHLSLT